MSNKFRSFVAPFVTASLVVTMWLPGAAVYAADEGASEEPEPVVEATEAPAPEAEPVVEAVEAPATRTSGKDFSANAELYAEGISSGNQGIFVSFNTSLPTQANEGDFILISWSSPERFYPDIETWGPEVFGEFSWGRPIGGIEYTPGETQLLIRLHQTLFGETGTAFVCFKDMVGQGGQLIVYMGEKSVEIFYPQNVTPEDPDDPENPSQPKPAEGGAAKSSDAAGAKPQVVLNPSLVDSVTKDAKNDELPATGDLVALLLYGAAVAGVTGATAFAAGVAGKRKKDKN